MWGYLVSSVLTVCVTLLIYLAYPNLFAYSMILCYLVFIAIVIGLDVNYRHGRYLIYKIEPDTFNILGIYNLFLGIVLIWKGITLDLHQFEFISMGIALFAIGIALFAWGISTESKERMDVIGGGDVQDSIIYLLDVRERFVDDINKQNKHLIENQDRPDFEIIEKDIFDILQGNTEWATWKHYRGILKALKYKEYFTIEDKTTILNSHGILISKVLREEYVGKFLLNRHVNHLLMATEKLIEELDNLIGKKNRDFEKEYTELFKKFLSPKKKREDFLKWISSNIVPSEEEDSPFQIIKNIKKMK